MATAIDLQRAVSTIRESAEFAQLRNWTGAVVGMSEDERIGYAKLSTELQAGLLRAHPDIYFPASGLWGASGWTCFRLDKLYVGELHDLLEEAFCSFAVVR